MSLDHTHSIYRTLCFCNMKKSNNRREEKRWERKKKKMRSNKDCNRLNNCSPKRHLHPNTWEFWILYMKKKKKEKTVQIWLRISKWGDCPGLSRWALSTITSNLQEGQRFDTDRREGNLTTEAEIGMTQPQTT